MGGLNSGTIIQICKNNKIGTLSFVNMYLYQLFKKTVFILINIIGNFKLYFELLTTCFIIIKYNYIRRM